MSLRTAFALCLGVFAIGLTACESTGGRHLPPVLPGESGYDVRRVGTNFRLGQREATMILVDDEYRLHAEAKGDWGRGMIETGWARNRADVEWAEWIEIGEVPGLRLAFLSPYEIAVRYVAPSGVDRSGWESDAK